MREGWKEVKLGEIINIKHGYGFKGEFFSDEETENILLTPGNFNIGGGFKADKLKYYAGPINENFILNENDVIVTMTDLSKMADTLGFSAKIPRDSSKKYLHNQRIGLVELINNTFDLDFIYWLLRTESYQRYIAGSAIGATVKHTSPNKIYTAKVQVPESKETQRKIAKILSNYDDLIENNLKRIKILEEMAQQTYEEWFVRMRFPGYETTKINETTGLPEGWERVKLGEVCNFSQGLQVPIEKQFTQFSNELIRFIRIVDVTQNTNDIRYIESPKSLNQFVHFKDVFMVRYGAPQVVTNYHGIIANNFFRININDENKLKRKFLFSFLNRNEIKENLLAMSVSATMPAISFKSFSTLDIILPEIEVQAKFHKYVDTTYDLILNLQNQNQRLREARDILLPRLMMGMVEV